MGAQILTADEQILTADEQVLTADEQVLTADERVLTAEELVLTAEEWIHTHGGAAPVDSHIDGTTPRRLSRGVDPINGGRPFRRPDAPAAGLTSRQLDQAVHEKRVRVVVAGSYVDASVPDSERLRIEAVDLVKPPAAVACGTTAAYCFGLDVRPPAKRFELTPQFVVPHGTSRMDREGADCRQALIDPEDVMQLPGGLLVTTPIRTVSDLLRGMYRPYALAAADTFARAELIDVPELVDYVHRLRGYRWIVQARSLSVLVDGRAQSPGESWTRLRIHDAGFPRPEPQFPLLDHRGGRRYLDLAFPHVRIACEYDGREFHTLQEDRAHDDGRRGDLTDFQDWRWVIATRARLFGVDTTFEDELGALLGMKPRPRAWGAR